MSESYTHHGQALEDFRLALVSAEATLAPIQFDVCLLAWAALQLFKWMFGSYNTVCLVSVLPIFSQAVNMRLPFRVRWVLNLGIPVGRENVVSEHVLHAIVLIGSPGAYS